MRMICTTILRDAGRNVVSVRRDAGVLGIGIKVGRPCVWTFAEADAIEYEARVFWAIRTGERSPYFDGMYIGTVQHAGTVRHVFEEPVTAEPLPLPPTLAERIVSRWPRFHVDDIPVVMEIIDEERAKDRWG